MLRIFRCRFVFVQALILLVPAAAIVISLGIQQEQHRQEVAAHAAANAKLAAFHSAERADRKIDEMITERDHRIAELTQKLDAANARADQAEAKVAALESVSYGVGSGPAQSVVVTASGPNHFIPGYCTYYVATRRYIPWFGNAWQWFGAAQALGWPTGGSPRPGAIMVTWESRYYGHVAYVEGVNGDGSWIVSEENYVAWGYVDRRTIRPGGVPLIGFVY